MQCTKLSSDILMIVQQSISTLVRFRCRSNRLEKKGGQSQALLYRQLFSILEMAPALKELAFGPVVLLDPIEDMLAKVSGRLERLEMNRVKHAAQVLPSVPILTPIENRVVAMTAATAATTLLQELDKQEQKQLLQEEQQREVLMLESFPKLKSLSLIWNDFPDDFQLNLICRSPKLESITWRRNTQVLTHAWLHQTLPVPENLTYLDIGHSHMDDDKIAQLLSMLPQLTGLCVRSTPFGDMSSMQLITHQAGQLEELDIVDCEQIHGGWIDYMLTVMPKLRLFAATELKAKHMIQSSWLDPIPYAEAPKGLRNLTAELMATTTMATTATAVSNPGSSAIAMLGPECNQIQPRQWVCFGLESLELTITELNLSGDVLTSEKALVTFYNQLALLTQLQVLTLCENIQPYEGKLFMIDLRLEHGLAKLAGLKRLRKLNITGLRAAMDEEEVKWMAREWPALEEVCGRLCHCLDDDKLATLEGTLTRLRPDIVVKRA
ncbi:hypothetical protein BGZ98_000292 [Dissophora globulifera]|nr:hypothetical protein BGZ98_000292 [Dissophora globulifera]